MDKKTLAAIVVLIITGVGIAAYSNYQANVSQQNSPSATPPPTAPITQDDPTISTTTPPVASKAITTNENVTSPPSSTAIPASDITPPTHYNYYPMTFSSAVETQRNSYVNICDTSGGTWGKCNCDFDYAISNYGLVWMINEEAYININGVASREARSEALDAANYCSGVGN